MHIFCALASTLYFVSLLLRMLQKRSRDALKLTSLVIGLQIPKMVLGTKIGAASQKLQASEIVKYQAFKSDGRPTHF